MIAYTDGATSIMFKMCHFQSTCIINLTSAMQGENENFQHFIYLMSAR